MTKQGDKTNFYCSNSGITSCCENQCGSCTLKVEFAQQYTQKLVSQLKDKTVKTKGL